MRLTEGPGESRSRYASGSGKTSEAAWRTTSRVDCEARSEASKEVTTVRSVQKRKRAIAIEKTVRKVRRFERRRFATMSRRYFKTEAPPCPGGRSSGLAPPREDRGSP